MKECKRCIMNDKYDKSISFDRNDFCNYCSEALEAIKANSDNDEIKLNNLLNEIKVYGINRQYDCLMGISGGIDSSYLAYLATYKWGLRVFAVHVDDGFDTEISKKNIDKLSKLPNLKLINYKPNKEQYNDLILSYIKAAVPDICIPQDNVLFAQLYNYARKFKFKYFLSGSNIATESILFKIPGANWQDLVNIIDIHNKYGLCKINKLKFIDKYRLFIDRKIFKYKTICPLNYINYNKDIAFNELNKEIGFEYYGSKHLENYLTAFNQVIWQPKKFSIDKRYAHLSSMVVSDQISRDEAIKEYNKEPVTENERKKIFNVICKTLNLDYKQLNKYINGTNHSFLEYKTDNTTYIIKKIISFFKLNSVSYNK